MLLTELTNKKKSVYLPIWRILLLKKKFQCCLSLVFFVETMCFVFFLSFFDNRYILSECTALFGIKFALKVTQNLLDIRKSQGKSQENGKSQARC